MLYLNCEEYTFTHVISCKVNSYYSIAISIIIQFIPKSYRVKKNLFVAYITFQEFTEYVLIIVAVYFGIILGSDDCALDYYAIMVHGYCAWMV